MTRKVGTLASGWDQDQSEYGYGDREVYAKRVREQFDKALANQEEADGTTLYRNGDEIIADEGYEGWDSGRQEEVLEACHEWAMQAAEWDAEQEAE